MKRLTERQLSTIIILLLPLVWFFPAVTGKLALVHGDGWTANLGLRLLTGKLLAEGMLPLWNPYIFGGMPLLGDIYPGVLYPPNWLFALLPPFAAMQVVVITTYHIALAGTYRYARSLAISRGGALLSAVVFSFGGYMMMSQGQTGNIAAAAWLPWILLVVEKLWQRVSWSRVALGAIFIALQFFAGVTQIVLYTMLTGGAYFLFSICFRQSRQNRRMFIAAVLMMAVGGLLLSAIQLLPVLELQRETGRARISYEYFASHSFPLRQVWALVVPYFFGGAALPPYRASYAGETGIYVTMGYTGLIAILLALAALLGRLRVRLIWFWAAMAVSAVLLAFGDYLPFGVNHLLYRIPVYNLFRGSFRHLVEFDLAIAVLAGLGANYLTAGHTKEKSSAVRWSIAALGTVMIAAVIAYHFFSHHPAPAQTRSLRNPEILIPLLLFVVGAILLWFVTRRQTRAGAWLLLIFSLIDLASCVQFLDWRLLTFSAADHLADPPTVKYIKSREPDLNSFRLLSYAPNPYNYNYELLNHPDLSIARGLQSVNGYEMLQLRRPAEVAGGMTAEGIVTETGALGLTHQGFNLLNVKYLLCERPEANAAPVSVSHEGVGFSETMLNLSLGKGARVELTGAGAFANELAIVSSMANSAGIADNLPMLKIALHTKDGRVIRRELLAGRDTAEWAWDRADVKATIRHRRARAVESWPVSDQAGAFEGHRYLARIEFDRAEIERIELEYAQTEAEINLARASLFDSVTRASIPLRAALLAPERWRKLASFYSVDVYENIKALPRAWFVSRVLKMTDAEILRTIREGKLSDGGGFDPLSVALLENDAVNDQLKSLAADTGATAARVTVESYEPQRIVMKTSAPQTAFLALSDIDYPGWQVLIDGQSAPVYRTNYTLRGVVVPAGARRVEFVYRPASVTSGALVSLAGVALLLGGAVITRYRFLNDGSDAQREQRVSH